MRRFRITSHTAIHYVRTAYPERFTIDPTQAWCRDRIGSPGCRFGRGPLRSRRGKGTIISLAAAEADRLL
ncbi:hypothetical protein QFZ74_000815 [Streptomyces sp. V3I7]|nr:hypothetical protein [Streptomyces sp. V3I7]